MVESTPLLRERRGDSTEGSNPSRSATSKSSLLGAFLLSEHEGREPLEPKAKQGLTAEFCETQNIPPIREALTAGTERSVVNLAVPLVRRGHQILSIPFRYQHCEIWTFKDKSPCLFHEIGSRLGIFYLIT